MKRKTIHAIVALAFALVAALCASPAMAYFSDSQTADGGFVVPIVPDTDIHEDPVVGGEKIVRVRNKGTELQGDSEVPVMVRAKVYFGDNAEATAVLGDGWSGPANPTGDGDVYNYSKVLAVDEETTNLKISVKLPGKSETNPDGPEAGDNFNVIILYEATPYIDYAADGTPTAVWTSN